MSALAKMTEKNQEIMLERIRYNTCEDRNTDWIWPTKRADHSAFLPYDPLRKEA